MTISQPKARLQDVPVECLGKVLDYLGNEDRRVFNTVDKAVFRNASFIRSLNRYATPNLCEEPAASPLLSLLHRQLANSMYAHTPRPICSKMLIHTEGKKITFLSLTLDGKSLISV